MINLVILVDTFSIYQITDKQEIPVEIISSGFYSITKTNDEISIVTSSFPESMKMRNLLVVIALFIVVI